MPDTVNSLFRDALIRHQIGLQRLSATTSKRVAAELKKVEADLKELIQKRIAAASVAQTLSPTTLKRLKTLEASVKALRGAAMDKAYDVLNREVRNVLLYEPDFLGQVVKHVSPVILDFATPPVAQLTSLVTTQPFQGKVLKEWAASQKVTDVKRIMDQVKIGMVQGQAIPDIMKRVVGVTDLTATEATAITRTAVNFYSNKAKEMTYRANADIFSEEQYVATLDARTTAICRGLDGKRFPVGEGPRPPLHFNCRSVRVAVIGDELVGNRPFNPTTERSLVKEYSAKHGLKAKTRDGLPKGHKGAFDDFARARKRQLIGRVPAATSYDEWLRTQSVDFQNEVLGKGKAELFRKGLTLDKFVDETGREFTLAELQASNTGNLLLKQPGMQQKAKAMLQQGVAPNQVPYELALQFPDADLADIPNVSQVTQWQKDLQAAGFLDQLKAVPLTKADKTAEAIFDIGDALENSLPSGLSSHVSGQWLSVADDLDGMPGVYAHYKAGYGVVASASKLGVIPKVQVQQVLAHELGHMLHKAHDLHLSEELLSQMQSTVKTMGPQSKNLYSYYLADPDELIGEIYAQALSPSPITSQGLPAASFNKLFANQIAAAKEQIAKKWPTITKPLANGAPTIPGATPGVFTNASSMTKALILQGLDNQSIITQVKAAFPEFKITTSRIASFRAKLKKQGLTPHTGPGPVVQPTTGVSHPKPEPIIKPSQELPKEWSIEIEKVAIDLGTSDPFVIADTLRKKFPDFIDQVDQFSPVYFKSEAQKALAKLNKPAAVPPPATPTPKTIDGSDLSEFVQIGDKPGGSVPGGLFQHKVTGKKYIIKFAKPEVSENEVLAGKLYELFGIKVPNLGIVKHAAKDGVYVASEVLDDFTLNKSLLETSDKVFEGFGADAYLANWDTVGLEYDNIGFIGNTPVRIDVGGSLLYRAQGGLKGAAFNGDVDELVTLLDPNMNPTSAKIFSKMTKEQMEASVKKVIAVPFKTIEDTINKFGPSDPVQKQKLIDIMRARHETMMKKFKYVLDQPTAAPTAPVSSAVPSIPTEWGNPIAKLHPSLTNKMEQLAAANKPFAAVLEEAKKLGIPMGNKKQAAFKELFADMKSGQVKKQAVPNSTPAPTPKPTPPAPGKLPDGMTQLQANYAEQIGVKPVDLHYANTMAKQGKSAQQIFNTLNGQALGYSELKLKEVANVAIGKFNKASFSNDGIWELSGPNKGTWKSPPPKPKSPEQLASELKPNRPAATPSDGLPPPPRFTDQDKVTAVRAWIGSEIENYVQTSKLKNYPGIKEHEYAILRAYTGDHYGQWNSRLRDGYYSSDYGLQALVEAANEGLSKLPIYRGTVMRGIGTYNLDRLFTVYREGVVVQEQAFVSTGKSRGFTGNVTFQIQSKTGRDVSGLSQHPGEVGGEVLFGPGARFKVTRTERHGDRATIFMEEVV